MSSKKLRRMELKANLYENDYDELLYSTEEPLKVKHIDHVKAPVKEKRIHKQETEKIPSNVFGAAISEKPVNCKCNKCGGAVSGTLVSFIYSPCSELITPFITYTCTHCTHVGFRSVQSRALPVAEFNQVYF